MNVNFEEVKLILAQKDIESHKKAVWEIFNENIEFFHLTSKKVPYKEHCKWWEEIFDKEHIYIIKFKSEICGYIRLTKKRSDNKEKHEISIALLELFQKSGIGSYAYQLFEKEMKHLGIPELTAKTVIDNIGGRNFFKKNGFEKSIITFKKKI